MKSLQNYFFFAKGNNSCKSKSSLTKLKLELYYVMTNLCSKFQVTISKDGREKSENKKCDGLTVGQSDRQTDRQTDRLTDRLTDSEQTKSPPASR